MKNFNILGFHWKIWFLGGEFMKKQYRRGDCLKRGALTVCRFKGGLGKKDGEGVFEGSWYPNTHYVPPTPKLTMALNKYNLTKKNKRHVSKMHHEIIEIRISSTWSHWCISDAGISVWAPKLSVPIKKNLIKINSYLAKSSTTFCLQMGFIFKFCF